MGKKQVPTASELREYLAKERAYLVDCVKNNKTFVITGPKFPGETIWRSKITLPLLEAAEEVWHIKRGNMGTVQKKNSNDTRSCYA